MVGLFQLGMTEFVQVDMGDLLLADLQAHMRMFLLWW
jgi:hypothetical protein